MRSNGVSVFFLPVARRQAPHARQARHWQPTPRGHARTASCVGLAAGEGRCNPPGLESPDAQTPGRENAHAPFGAARDRATALRPPGAARPPPFSPPRQDLVAPTTAPTKRRLHLSPACARPCPLSSAHPAAGSRVSCPGTASCRRCVPTYRPELAARSIGQPAALRESQAPAPASRTCASLSPPPRRGTNGPRKPGRRHAPTVRTQTLRRGSHASVDQLTAEASRGANGEVAGVRARGERCADAPRQHRASTLRVSGGAFAEAAPRTPLAKLRGMFAFSAP